VTGALVALTGVMRLDPLVSLVIAGLIVWGTWSLLRQSTAMALHAVPPHIDPTAVRAHLASLPGVTGVHDLHIWSMSTTETALTSHLVMPKGHPGDAFLAQVAGSLREKFKIAHATLQIELADAAACAHEPDEVL
jgi:cobalt-zinc-cadmium efflux system protein